MLLTARSYLPPAAARLANNCAGKSSAIQLSLLPLICLACLPACLPAPPQAQVAVADVDNDGRLEMVVGDARGNLAAFNYKGKEVWETHLNSQIHQVGGGPAVRAVPCSCAAGDWRPEVSCNALLWCSHPLPMSSPAGHALAACCRMPCLVTLMVMGSLRLWWPPSGKGSSRQQWQ